VDGKDKSDSVYRHAGNYKLKGQRVRREVERCGMSVKVDMKRLGLVKDDAHNRDKWTSLTTGNRPTLPRYGNEGVILYGSLSRDVKH